MNICYFCRRRRLNKSLIRYGAFGMNLKCCLDGKDCDKAVEKKLKERES